MGVAAAKSPARDHTNVASNDAQALDEARSGNLRALDPLWRASHSSALAYARALTRTFDAEDVVSEAMARVLQAIRNGHGPQTHFRQYFRAAVRSTIISWSRQQAETHQDLDFWLMLEGENNVADAELRARILETLRSLQPSVREIIWRADVLGESASSIASGLGTTTGASYVALHRARHAFRAAWEKPATAPTQAQRA